MTARVRRWGPVTAVLLGAACTGTIRELGGSGPEGGSAMNGSGGGAANADGGPGGSASAPGGVFSAYESLVRRLSQAELDNTLRDVFFDRSAPASTFLPEDEFSPYDNDYHLQDPSQALIDSLDALAEDVATRLLADPTARDALVTCTPANDGDATCFEQVVRELLTNAFRRPVTDEEVAPYMGLLAFATEDDPYVQSDFYTAVGLLVQSVVQDPEFLYRIEIGTETTAAGVRALDAYEVASRMSYLLWGSAPDAALFEVANAGTLLDPAVRRAEAERLLADDRARDQVHRFHAMWLGYRAIPHTAELVAGFQTETGALLDRVIFDERGSYLDVFTFGETYLDDALAAHYGLPAPGGAGWVPYGDTGRAGILSHGSVLAAFSKFSDTSPTQRGIFVRNRLLCEIIPSPPATVDVDQPPGDDDAVCKVDRYAEHRSVASCASCHDLMDPIGFGLEQYDIGGRVREHDEGLPECTIDGVGELPGYGPFSGPAELGQLLVDSGELESCVVQQYLTFAIGRPLEGTEVTVALEDRISGFQSQGHGFAELVLAFVEDETFILKKEPEVTP